MERDNTEKLVSELKMQSLSSDYAAKLEVKSSARDWTSSNEVSERIMEVPKHYLSSICERRQDYILFEIKLFFLPGRKKS